MLERSLAKVSGLLEAKETKFFSFQGGVTDSREVDAHSIQIKAAELILQMSDLLARQQVKPQEKKIIVHVDPKSGAMYLVIGDESEDEVPAIAPVAVSAIIDVTPQEEPIVQNDVVEETNEEWERIKVNRGKLDPNVRKALFG